MSQRKPTRIFQRAPRVRAPQSGQTQPPRGFSGKISPHTRLNAKDLPEHSTTRYLHTPYGLLYPIHHVCQDSNTGPPTGRPDELTNWASDHLYLYRKLAASNNSPFIYVVVSLLNSPATLHLPQSTQKLFISKMSSKTKSKIPTVSTIVSTIGSVAAAAVVARSVARDYLPPEVRNYLYLGLRNIINKFSTHLTMVIYESEGFQDNELYEATELYLAAKMSTQIHLLKVTKTPNQSNITVAMEVNEEFTDVFNGVKLYWSLVSKRTAHRQTRSNDGMNYATRNDLRSFELTFHRQHKDMVLNDYLPFVLKEAEARKQEQKTLKLFTITTSSSYPRPMTWKSVNLDHPANFDTLAMDSGMKEKVMTDLDRFVQRREYYRKVGKAWKRGYLLYGPPGTGKSSLIAAMANYLNFDIYDLELTDVKSNSELRTLLLATANQSILVVEDIDCSVEFHDREAKEAEKALAQKKGKSHSIDEKKVTLSGFLNYIDGLWSSCGDERIIIFTTNRKEKLDPALIRPGRMDVHIHMSYCTPCGFRQLVSNYLGITQHNLFKQIEDLICEINVTPAEIAEQLLTHDDPDIVFGGLIEFFDVKRNENEEEEAKKAKKIEEENLAKKESEKDEKKLAEIPVKTMRNSIRLIDKENTSSLVEQGF
ncbi:hypothetical protein LXL04_013767 [Taraxacum kok-saghyz]